MAGGLGVLLRLRRLPLAAPLLLAAVVGFGVAVELRGGWPALPPPSRFWWAAWAAPAGLLLAEGLGRLPVVRPPRALPWAHVPVALALGGGVALRASALLGSLAALWGGALLGALLAGLRAPPARALGMRTTSLLVGGGLLLAAWHDAAFPLGPTLLLGGGLLAASLPLSGRKGFVAAIVAVGLAAGGALWARATSEILDLYGGLGG